MTANEIDKRIQDGRKLKGIVDVDRFQSNAPGNPDGIEAKT